MGIATSTAVAMGAMAVAGGIAGAMGSEEESRQRLLLGDPSALENQAQGLTAEQLTVLQNLVGKGPGERDVVAGTQAQRDFAAQLNQLSRTGINPDNNDIFRANQFSRDIFAARRTSLDQTFQDQLTQNNQRLASLGRDINDPIFRAQMLQSQNRQRDLLNAEQAGFSANFANNLAGQRVQFSGQRANMLGQLSQQAMQNRMALLQAGSGTLAQERNFRLARAELVGTTSSGGGFGGFLTGAIGGAGAGASMMAGIGGLGTLPGGVSNMGAQSESMVNTLPTPSMQTPAAPYGLRASHSIYGIG